ncbi:hypothetical protein BCR33DRAFT_116173 [Rhizoclosmatium globosum]|uniref:Zinc finger PHD-type domain-containing protein n=1 Tax=Rhizoclosmatium globosum TaxID=329046 RepID=A0A1Y2CJ48_9FUNG|nr:hypothetical protein BCR33DRAFT_116173 [Rhizoclosmatium globosum]|eukprot:ORY47062.1 hypothetical protein BCR33DRAFT_116173 [Rhizoclosmatium globosum]
MKGDLFCYCRSLWDGRFMMQCNQCKEWFHGACLSPQVKEEDSLTFQTFHCAECSVLYGPSIS